MSRDKFLHFRDILLEMRRDMVSRVQDIENRWQQVSEPAIEQEEEAQRATIALPYDRLDETGRRTIEQIDIAINDILAGEYGICEDCGDEISLKRLEAVPWTRLCIDCAGDLERKPQPVEPAEESFELVVDEAIFEREGRAPGKSGPSAGPPIEDSLFNDARALTGDLAEGGDEKPYHPPENALPGDYAAKRGRPRHRAHSPGP